MSQGTRLRLRDQINLCRNTPDQIAFAELLDPKVVEEALNSEGVSCGPHAHARRRDGLGGSRSAGNLGLRSSQKDTAAKRHETLNAGSVTVFDEARNRQSFHPR